MKACIDFTIHEQPETRLEAFINELGILPLSDTLRHAAQTHADSEGYLVVVLATSGYIDMLANFLCSATASPVNNNHILVITPNQDIAEVARHFGVGSYMPPSHVVSPSSYNSPHNGTHPDTHTNPSATGPTSTAPTGTRHPPLLSIADFGTLQYQVSE